MDKIILVFYVNVGNLSPQKVAEHMGKIRDMCQSDEIIQYFIPVVNQDTKVECLNPKIVSKEDYNKVKEILDKNQKIVDYISENTIESIYTAYNRKVKIDDIFN